MSDTPRNTAFRILKKVFTKNGFASALLKNRLDKHPDPRDKALVTTVVYGVLRWKNRLDVYIETFSDRGIDSLDPGVLILLRMGLYQIFMLDRIPAPAAVDETVELGKKHLNRGVGGFLNGVLRTAIRKSGKVSFPDRRENPEEYITKYLSQPRWLVERWIDRHGVAEACRIASILNKPPEVTLRMNKIKTSFAEFKEFLNSNEIEYQISDYCSDTFLVDSRILKRKYLETGYFYVQSLASQIIPFIVNPIEGEKILDACCAPGGKLTHLHSLNKNAVLTGMDIHHKKLKKTRNNCKRLGCNDSVNLVRADIKNSPFLKKFDKILLDVPCSGLGTIRGNPEIKWKRTPSDFKDSGEKQKEMLESALRGVKKGGKLIYSVCSSEPEETNEVIDSILLSNNDISVLNIEGCLPEKCAEMSDGKFFKTLPHKHNTDGFFAAVLKKTG